MRRDTNIISQKPAAANCDYLQNCAFFFVHFDNFCLFCKNAYPMRMLPSVPVSKQAL